MRCKERDIAIVITPGDRCNNVGRMVCVKQWITYPIRGSDGTLWIGPGWLCATLGHGLSTPVGTVMERLFDDDMLIPLRGEQEAVDGEECLGIVARG